MIFRLFRLLTNAGHPRNGLSALSRVLLASIAMIVALQVAPASAKYAALVLDADTGGVLYSRNADTRNYPASLTKMMTLYLTFEALEQKRLRLDSALPVSRRAAGQPASKLGLQVGDSITVHEAILSLVTKSANDVATVLAEALGRTEVDFAIQMTKTARRLGMQRTTFRNASGLPNRRQLSTAADMARLAMAHQRDFPQYYKYFATTEFTFRGRVYRSHNNVLKNYKGAEGMKTGYIRASGFNLVSSVKRDGHRLIGVVFGGRTAASRDSHMRRLLDTSFRRVASNPKIASYIRPMEITPTSPAHLPKRFAKVPQPPRRPVDLADEVVAVHAPSRGNWAVQVGAYWQQDKAARRLDALAASHPDLLADGERTVSAKKAGRRTIYRARFRGLPEHDARDACKLLSRQDIDCLAIPPANASLQTANSAG